jgi:hypothetical protein
MSVRSEWRKHVYLGNRPLGDQIRAKVPAGAKFKMAVVPGKVVVTR